MLQALSPKASARDTSLNNETKTKTVVVVSILDHAAFTEADVQSLERFVRNLLPDHDFIHATQSIPYTWGRVIAPNVMKGVREGIRNQLIEQLKPHHEISHLILMDHGNTDFSHRETQESKDTETRTAETSTIFRYLSTFGEKNVDKQFRYIFDPLVGRFSNNAFVMLESCLTMCSDLWISQKRAKTLMSFFKIKNGTLFGSYQEMVSVGYESRFHFEQALQNLKNPVFIGIAVAIGVALNFENILNNSFDISTFLIAAGLSDMAIAVIYKTFAYFHEKSRTANWGYLYKFKNSQLEQVYNLEPYSNKNNLFLHAKPEFIRGNFGRCGSLFH